ncbi:NIL domain-containing protein [Synechocystis sp. LKSZ1]|uniref:NIL domain-containing protein n=1 Tax=Synechocystis sp. LKSZ1 TaxID=3144951 RepID=UPI00336C0103
MREVSSFNKNLVTIRLGLSIPYSYKSTPIIYKLIAYYDLVVNITKADFLDNRQEAGRFELEMRRTPQKIEKALAYLKTANIDFRVRSNFAGDSWHY